MIRPGSVKIFDGKGQVKILADQLEPARGISRLTINEDSVTEIGPFLQDLRSQEDPLGPSTTGLQMSDRGYCIGPNGLGFGIDRNRYRGGTQTSEQQIDLANQFLRPHEQGLPECLPTAQSVRKNSG